MALTKCNVPGDVIGSLATRAEERLLSTQAFKDKFDEMPEGIKQYINEVLTEEIDDLIDEKANKSWSGPYELPLQNGWTGSLYYEYNVGLGLVKISGEIIAGTTSWNTTISALPASITPSHNTAVTTIRSTTPYDNLIGFCIISSNFRVRRPASDVLSGGDVIQVNFVYKI